MSRWPSARAAWTNSMSLSVRIDARTTRANWGTRKIATTAPPATAARFLITRCSVSAQNPDAREAVDVVGSLIPNARVEEGVRDVRQKVHRHEGRRDDQHRALHDRIVAGENALDDQPADPGQREAGLRQHGAAQVGTELEPEDRQDWDHHVLERVTVDDDAFADALRARRPNVILTEHLEHRGPRHPREPARGRSAERERRHEQKDGAPAS